MRIGIEAQRIFHPKKNREDICALELIQSLQEIDDAHEYIVFVRTDEDKCLSERKNLRIVEVPGKTYLDWEQIELPKAIRREKINLMHFTSSTAPIKLDCPFILTLYDTKYDTDYLHCSFSISGWQKMIATIYQKWNLSKIAPKAKYILTTSEYEKKRIQESLSLNAQQIQVIYQAYNQQFCLIDNTDTLERIRAKYKLPTYFIFYIEPQEPNENIKNILASYAEYFDLEKNALNLVIAGNSEKEIKKALKQIHREDIFNKIILIDSFPHIDLPYLYNLSTLFLYPLLNESIGIQIIEAMACGTPVITSNTHTLPEIAKDAAMLINPSDTFAIANTIQKVLNSHRLYNYLKYQGLSRAMYFSWERTARKVIKRYQNI